MRRNSFITQTLKKYWLINRNPIYTYYKSSGYWIRIPLFNKEVMDNGSEFHY